jgi:transcriptional antiterminator NusG
MSEAAAKKEVKFKWYVVQSQTNYEKRVQHHIKEQSMLQSLDALIQEVVIPTEQVVEVKKGQKKTTERKFFPGYVLVKAQMTDEVWHLIKNINHVTGFVGANRGMKPMPITNSEAERILKQMEEGVEEARPVIDFEVGEEIRVIDGPFASFQGMVEAIDEEKAKLKVSVSIFGRATPIELEFTQVEKS